MGKRDRFSIVSEDDPQFCRFWDAYPKRVSKKDARKAWAEIQPTADTVALMIVALEWQREQPEWVKAGGQFIPYPASWLRAERWMDERMQMPKPGGFNPGGSKLPAWAQKKAQA